MQSDVKLALLKIGGLVAVIPAAFLAMFALKHCDQPSKLRLSPTQKAEISALIASTFAERDRNDAERREGLRSWLVLPSRPDPDPCSIANPSTAGRVQVRRDGVLDADARSPAWKWRRTDLEITQNRLNADLIDTSDADTPELLIEKLRRAREQSALDYDFLLVVDSWIDPVLHEEAPAGTTRFTPGRMTGRLILWSYLKKSVLCAGSISATNSDQLDVRRRWGLIDNNTLKLELAKDLEEQAEKAGLASLTKSGAPAPKP